MYNGHDHGSEDELATYLFTNYGVESLRELLKKKPSPTLLTLWNLSEEQYIAQVEKAIDKILVD